MAFQPESTRIMLWNIDGPGVNKEDIADQLESQNSIHSYVTVGGKKDALMLVTGTYSNTNYPKDPTDIARDWGFSQAGYTDLLVGPPATPTAGILIASDKLEASRTIELDDQHALAAIVGGRNLLQLAGLCVSSADKTAADKAVRTLLEQLEPDLETIVYVTSDNERRPGLDQRIIKLGKRGMAGAMSNLQGAGQKLGLPSVSDVVPQLAKFGYRQAKANVPSLPTLFKTKEPANDLIAYRTAVPPRLNVDHSGLSTHDALFVELPSAG